MNGGSQSNILYGDRKSAPLGDRKSAPAAEDKCEHFCRIPDSVMHDKVLSASAICVYGYMAGRTHLGNVANCGTKTISRWTGISRSTVKLGIAQLVERGHLKEAKAKWRTNSYILTSNIFGRKLRQKDEEEKQKHRKFSNPALVKKLQQRNSKTALDCG